MGKRLIQQRRGKGSSTYRAPSFRYAGKAEHPKLVEGMSKGVVEEFVHCQGHSAPLMVVRYPHQFNLTVAPEGVRVGDEINLCDAENVQSGNSLMLKDIPEGTEIFNIEGKPGDGGKFVRTSGAAARIVSKSEKKVTIRLPSKKQKEFDAKCMATIGIVAGGGRVDKPLLRAGTKFFKMKAKNKLWPSVSGNSMNAVDHPFGSKKSNSKGRPTQSPRNAPPGRKVGKIAPRRTGRK